MAATKKEEEELKNELADVFIGVMLFALEMDLDLSKIANKKLADLDKKYPAEKVKGISARELHEQGKIIKKISL